MSAPRAGRRGRVVGRRRTARLIDLDGEITGQDKTAMGDVELPIPGDVQPVPEPQ